MMEGVNLTMIYCKNFCKCQNVPQYNNNNNNNSFENLKKKKKKAMAFPLDQKEE
jgi:hypothetical protein